MSTAGGAANCVRAVVHRRSRDARADRSLTHDDFVLPRDHVGRGVGLCVASGRAAGAGAVCDQAAARGAVRVPGAAQNRSAVAAGDRGFSPGAVRRRRDRALSARRHTGGCRRPQCAPRSRAHGGAARPHRRGGAACGAASEGSRRRRRLASAVALLHPARRAREGGGCRTPRRRARPQDRERRRSGGAVRHRRGPGDRQWRQGRARGAAPLRGGARAPIPAIPARASISASRQRRTVMARTRSRAGSRSKPIRPPMRRGLPDCAPISTGSPPPWASAPPRWPSAAPRSPRQRRRPAPGPTQADVAAAAQMAPDDRSAMVAAMVQRLADRLQHEPGDVDGWLRLGRAYARARRPAEIARCLSPRDRGRSHARGCARGLCRRRGRRANDGDGNAQEGRRCGPCRGRTARRRWPAAPAIPARRSRCPTRSSATP